MVFQKEDGRSFFGLLRRLVSKESKNASGDAEECWGLGPPALEDTERAYEIAESLEGGMARELASDFTHPLRRSSKLWKFKVVRSEDRLQYRLYSGAGDFLMYAKASLDERSFSFFLYNPTEKQDAALFDASRPAFTMACDEAGTTWRLQEKRCEQCCYAPKRVQCACKNCNEIALVRHTKKQVGEGIFNYMEIQTPGLCPGGGPPVTCILDTSTAEPQMLATKRPKWNDDVDCLVLDFKGRNVLSSAKNFQLSAPQRPEHVVCQYAKTGPSTFGLDFRYPLGVVQAFGISLSTVNWT